MMAQAWCVTKPDGKALIGIPLGPGQDAVYFNAHRVYGPTMLPHLFARWTQVYSELNYTWYDRICESCYQELFVVQKEIENNEKL